MFGRKINQVFSNDIFYVEWAGFGNLWFVVERATKKKLASYQSQEEAIADAEHRKSTGVTYEVYTEADYLK